MAYVVYSFEAKSIQAYVLASSKLKDRVGASEQIENLCAPDGLLDDVLAQLALEQVRFARRAGGAFIAVLAGEARENRQRLEELRAVWTLCVQKELPGLRFAQGIGEHEQSVKEAVLAALDEQRLSRQRLFSVLPQAGPLVTRSQRTGEPAVLARKLDNGEEELLDEATRLQRKFAHGDRVTGKLGNLGREGLTWPIRMPEEDANRSNEPAFPLLDNNYIAVLHADINNLGAIARNLFAQYADGDYLRDAPAFSEAVEQAVREAAHAAAVAIADKAHGRYTVMPARPLVLAGDDTTFILRGDVALEFTKVFLETVESASAEHLRVLRKKYRNLPTCLTACAGLAYVKAAQPFYQAYRLCESLCATAKDFSKQLASEQDLSIVPSSVAFHRITNTLIEVYETVVEQELRKPGKILTMQPYLVGGVVPNQTPQLADLLDLTKAIRGAAGHGRIRELFTLLHHGEARANREFMRWREVMAETGKKKAADNIVNTLKKITECATSAEPAFADLLHGRGETKRTPLGDAVALARVG